MSIQYVGRPVETDFSVVNKKFVVDRYSTIKVDTPYVDSQVAEQGSALVTTGYVDSQDALRAKKANVDAADALYVPNTQVGQPNGLVPLDAASYVPGSVLPSTLQTSRKVGFVVPAPADIFLGTEQNVGNVTAKEFRAATLIINDPGYPYIPLFFAQIRGGAKNATPVNRGVGSTSYGQISVLRASDDLRVAWGLATSHKQMAFHNVIPFADTTTSSATRPLITGPSTWNLWLGLWGGSTYTFASAGFTWYGLVYPGV